MSPTSVLSKDRRSRRRYPIALPLQYKLLDENDRTHCLGAGQTLNISSCGILFEVDDELPNRGKIELALEWPLLLGSRNLKLVVRGRIVRKEHNTAAVKAECYEFRTVGYAANGMKS